MTKDSRTAFVQAKLDKCLQEIKCLGFVIHIEVETGLGETTIFSEITIGNFIFEEESGR